VRFVNRRRGRSEFPRWSRGSGGPVRHFLETAISVDPKYADAHFNLAVVLATNDPPDKESAGKYYQQARELGAERDESLEQLIK
jgi:Tfp pilus assembly protein PilF